MRGSVNPGMSRGGRVSDNGKNGKDIHKEKGERRIVRDGGNSTVYRGRSKERASLSFSYDKKPETKAPAARKTEPATRIYDAGQLKAETRVMERKVVADSENKDIVKEIQEAAAREEAASAAKPSVAAAIKDRFNEKKEEIKKARADAAVRKLQRSRAESAARAADEKAAKEKAAKKQAKKTVKYPGKQIKKQTSVQSKKPHRIETAKTKSKKTSGKTSANKAAFNFPVSKLKSKAKKPKKTKRPKTKKQKALAYLLAA